MSGLKCLFSSVLLFILLLVVFPPLFFLFLFFPPPLPSSWMITTTPLGTDVLLMTPQFSSVQNFYIRVKSLQLESHG